MPTVTDFPHPPVPTGVCRFIVMLMALASLSACAPSNQAADEELRKEIQALKAQVTVMQEKLNQVQTGQQVILDLLKQPAPAPAPMAPSAPMAVPSQPPAPDALTVDRTPGQQRPLPGHPGEGQGHAGTGYGAP